MNRAPRSTPIRSTLGRSTLAAILCGLVAIGQATAAPLTLYTNIQSSQDITDTASSTVWLANQFYTYNYQAAITKLTLLFNIVEHTAPDLNLLHVDLYSSTQAGLPDAQLARFTNPSSGSGSVYDFYLSVTPWLEANSTYFIVVSESGTWKGTFPQATGNDDPSDPSRFVAQSPYWVNGTYSPGTGVTWGSLDTFGPYQMEVNVVAVPEPSTLAMVGGGGLAAALAARKRRKLACGA